MTEADHDTFIDDELDEAAGLEIAVVGMACRFPGADDVDTFWRNLLAGVESIHHFSDEELYAAGHSAEAITLPNFVRSARLIEGVDLFDAPFFSLSPREAEIMDPQQRLFLQLCWQALEDAGYDPERYDGLVGVYGGAKSNTYLFHCYANPQVMATMSPFLIQMGNDKDFLAARVSYKLNLGGPSVSVQTACSTSLVACHVACQNLLSGDCDMALAGAVSIVPGEAGYLYREGEVLSPDGHVRAFSADAAGTVFGNGLGVVVLKRLEDALDDGDTIHAVIRGSAVNNDGARKAGFAAPGIDGQTRVLRGALLSADVEADSIGFVEAHGTGTPTGDPIEMAALTQVYDDVEGPVALGAAKNNVGHLAAAAGIVGLIKTIKVVETGVVPPNILIDEINPQIDLDATPFVISTERGEFPATDGPRRAGVSSFGLGGQNAHLILEQAPEPEPVDAPRRPYQLLRLSARTATALDGRSSTLASHLAAHPEQSLADIAYTLDVGRRSFEHRAFVVAADHDGASAALAGKVKRAVVEIGKPPVAFLFSGQGAQYAGMGRGLYDREPVFRDVVDRCAERLRAPLGLDLRELLMPDDVEAATEKLADTRFTQPALFTVELAMASLWRAWGVEPAALLGHSIGEWVAAHLAGVFSLDDALGLVAERGRLMGSLPGGDMLAVPLDEDELTSRLDGRVSIAALNAPGRTVVSGPRAAVAELAAALDEDGIRSQPLVTSHAFHSAMMEPVLEPFAAKVAAVERHAPALPFVSNVTGTWITEQEATDPGYWARHLRQAVRFADGVATVLGGSPSPVLLEVGPGTSLATLARRHPARGGRPVIASMRHPKRGDADDLAVALEASGELFLAGVELDAEAFWGEEKRRRVPLPTYVFDSQRYWIDAPDLDHLQALAAGDAPRPAGLRQAVPRQRHARPELSTSLVEPRNEVERQLAEVWAEVLGLEDIGVDDNYFDLGGDSVVAVTLVSRAAERGLRFSPDLLFTHPTVAELATQVAAPDDAETAVDDEADDSDFTDAGLSDDQLAKVLGQLEEGD
ncbi:MAG: type I polyketide synthase [Acidobacteriota bacterium]